MVNTATVKLIKEFEGCKLTAYRDSVGVWTIGYGITAKADVGIVPAAGMTITQEQAEGYLVAALYGFSEGVRALIKFPVNENEFGACVSLAYNIGLNGFKKSTVLRQLNEGNLPQAANAFLMWNKANGKVLKGLTRRREAERKLFLAPINPLEAPQTTDRRSPARSTTMQASAAQVASAGGAAVAAVSQLTGTAQTIVLVFAGVVAIAALWIMKERLRRWADGDR